jgi:solute carrier family 13 (sodium-dependent dicarboxylate transporter), member 2/3/5
LSPGKLVAHRETLGRWLGPAVFLFFLILPGPATMPQAAWNTAGIALWMAIWWITEAVPIAVTALLPLALFPSLGILSSADTASNYGNHLIFLFFGGFVLALALEEQGLHRRFALQVVHWIGGSPRRILLGFMLVAAVLSMWMSNTAATVLMLPIGMAVVRSAAQGARIGDQSGPEVESKVVRSYGPLLMVGLAYAASIGGMGTLIGTAPNLVFAGTVDSLFPGAPEIGFLQWMMLGVPLVLILLPISWWYLAWRASPVDLDTLWLGISDRERVRRERAALGSWSGSQRWVASIFLLAALAWVFRSPLELGRVRVPGWSEILPVPSYLHDSTVAMVAALLLLSIPVRRGSREGVAEPRFAVSWGQVQKGVPWGILILFGGGFALAAGFQGSGLAPWLGERLQGLSGVPPILLVALIALTVTFLTEVTSNTATTTMLMPVLAATAHGAGVHPFLLMLPATLSASCAFMLPVATPPNAIVFGSGWVRVSFLARVGLRMNLIGVVVITLVVYFLAGPVFGITSAGMPAWAGP